MRWKKRNNVPAYDIDSFALLNSLEYVEGPHPLSTHSIVTGREALSFLEAKWTQKHLHQRYPIFISTGMQKMRWIGYFSIPTTMPLWGRSQLQVSASHFRFENVWGRVCFRDKKIDPQFIPSPFVHIRSSQWPSNWTIQRDSAGYGRVAHLLKAQRRGCQRPG